MTFRSSANPARPFIIMALAFSITGCGRDVARRATEIQDTFHVTGLAFSPDGALLATSSLATNEVHIWSLIDKPKMIKTLKQDPDTPIEAWAVSYSQVDGLRFTKDGSRLVNVHNGGAGNGFRLMRIWSTTSWTPIADVAEEKPGGGVFPAQVAVSSDGRFIIRPRRAQLEAFDTATGQPAWSVPLPVESEELALSPDGRRAAVVGIDNSAGPPQGPRTPVGRLCLVDLEARTLESCFDALEHWQLQNVAAWSPDGRFIAVSGNPNNYILDVTARRAVRTFAFDETTAALQYSADGRYLLVAGWDRVELWDSGHTKLLQEITSFGVPGVTIIRGGEPAITAVRFSADGHRLAIAFQGTVRVYDLPN